MINNINLDQGLVVKVLHRFYGADIQSFKNEAQLCCSDLHNFISILWPGKAVLLKPFLPKTKTVSVPVQDLEYRVSAVAERKQMAEKGIKPQAVLNQDGERIDCLSHISVSRSKENAYLWRHVDHILPRVLTTRSRSSASNPLPISIRYRPITRQS